MMLLACWPVLAVLGGSAMARVESTGVNIILVRCSVEGPEMVPVLARPRTVVQESVVAVALIVKVASIRLVRGRGMRSEIGNGATTWRKNVRCGARLVSHPLCFMVNIARQNQMTMRMMTTSERRLSVH
jgi:hypothetical protein